MDRRLGSAGREQVLSDQSETAIILADEPIKRYLIHFCSRRFGSGDIRNSEWACHTFRTFWPRNRSISFANQAAKS